MYDTFGVDMIQIITASHGPLSEAIIKSASIIAGSDITKNLKHIQITMDTSTEEAKKLVEEALNSFDSNDVILALTDLCYAVCQDDAHKEKKYD